jgi:hypothetical protein
LRVNSDQIENKVVKILKNPKNKVAKLKRLIKMFELISYTLNWRRFTLYNTRLASMFVPSHIFVNDAGKQTVNLINADRHFYGII